MPEMKALIASVLFLTAVAAQVGQVTPPAAQQPEDTVKPEDKCSVEGTVLNAQTKEPLKKAHVSLMPAESQKFNSTSWGAVTDAAGHFVVEDVNPGKYRFSAERNGFVRTEYESKGAGKSGALLTLSKGQKVTAVVFRMTPHGVISGKVVDEDGEALAGAHILVMHNVYRSGKKTLSTDSNASSDDRGEYRAYGVAPGKYYVCVSYDRGGNMMQQVEIRKEGPQDGYAPTYFPNATSMAQASPVEVIAGGEVSAIDFRLNPVHTAHISGKVTNPGAGARGVSVMLMPRDSGMGWAMMKHAIADDKGNFLFQQHHPWLIYADGPVVHDLRTANRGNCGRGRRFECGWHSTYLRYGAGDQRAGDRR
jgi:protocatechuate 3,4-dioxygenase beta subunit